MNGSRAIPLPHMAASMEQIGAFEGEPTSWEKVPTVPYTTSSWYCMA